jgi:hypothetical protein
MGGEELLTFAHSDAELEAGVGDEGNMVSTHPILELMRLPLSYTFREDGRSTQHRNSD